MKKTGKLTSALITAFFAVSSLAVPASAKEKMSCEISYGSDYTSLTLAPADEDNVIRYTVDGSKPDASSKKYTETLLAKETVTIRAAEFNKNNKIVSSVKVVMRRRCEKVNITAKKTDGGYLVTLSSGTSGCNIFYTTDGSKPDSDSELYYKPFFVEKGSVVRAYAGKKDWKNSAYLKATINSKTKKTKEEPEYGTLNTEVLGLINAYRAENGLSALEFDDVLFDAAKKRAKEISEYYNHTRPDGSSWFTVLDELDFPYQMAAENIAWTEGELSTAEYIVNSWIESAPHRKNILIGEFDLTGIYTVRVGETVYWVQLFGKRR